MLDRIYVFNNSLRLRGPIFARRPSSPISSFNNAVEFPDCRQGCNEQVIELRLDSDVSCLPFRRMTADGRFLHSDCFNLEPENVPGYGMTKGPHAFAHNAFNRPLAADIAAAERNLTLVEGSLFAPAPAAESLGGRIEARFRLPAGSPLATAGCALTFDAATGLVCQQGTAGALVGALAPDGKRFDFALPFGYPFEAALRYATP
jgi:hypothetical protein